jgi:hypothetical protein
MTFYTQGLVTWLTAHAPTTQMFNQDHPCLHSPHRLLSVPQQPHLLFLLLVPPDAMHAWGPRPPCPLPPSRFQPLFRPLPLPSTQLLRCQYLYLFCTSTASNLSTWKRPAVLITLSGLARGLCCCGSTRPASSASCFVASLRAHSGDHHWMLSAAKQERGGGCGCGCQEWNVAEASSGATKS